MPKPSAQPLPALEFNRALRALGDAQRLQHLLRAAEQGCLRAQFLVGLLYHMGKGVAVDYARAAGWYEQAAAGGDSYAMANLGIIHLLGQAGKADEVEAYTWIRSAAGLGRHGLDAVLELLERRITGNAARPETWPVEIETPDLSPCVRQRCDPSRCDPI